MTISSESGHLQIIELPTLLQRPVVRQLKARIAVLSLRGITKSMGC